MFSFNKKLCTIFAVLQLLTLQINADTTSHIAYTSAWTSSGIAEELNNELNLVQKQAKNENKFFELLEISIVSDWRCAYIFYNLSDRMGETNSLITQIAYVNAWTSSGLADKIQEEINFLQYFAFNTNKNINFLDINLIPEWRCCYIIYEISE